MKNFVFLENEQCIVDVYNVIKGDIVSGFNVITKILDIDISEDVYEVITSRNYKIKVSGDTLLNILGSNKIEFMKIKNLSVGDNVILFSPKNIGPLKNIKLLDIPYKSKRKYELLNDQIMPIELDYKLAYILGYAYGDGSIEFDKFGEPDCISLACSDDYPEIKEKLYKYIKDVFNYTACFKKGDGRLEKIDIHSKRICHFLNNNNILKNKAIILKFPEILLKSPKLVVGSFISGYFDADGYASGRKKGYVFSSVANPFLEQINILLNINSIFTRTHVEDRSNKENWLDLYSLSIVGGYSTKNTLEFLTESIKIQNKAYISKRDTGLTPYTFKDLNCITPHKKITYTPRDGVTLLSQKALSKLIEDQYIKDRTIPLIDHVISITKLDKEYIFTFKTEENNAYYCNGFLIK